MTKTYSVTKSVISIGDLDTEIWLQMTMAWIEGIITILPFVEKKEELKCYCSTIPMYMKLMESDVKWKVPACIIFIF